jgi:hypothetical protein
VPRLLPPAFSLVKANSRVTLGGLLATGAAAPLGAGLQALGPRYPLYGAFLIFVGGTFLSFSLPRKVDSAKGERPALLASGNHRHHGRPGHDEALGTEPALADAPDGCAGPCPGAETGSTATAAGKAARRRPGLRSVGSTVIHALAANASLRCLSGFLIFFLAFLLREHPLAGSSAAVSLGIVGVAAGTGNALGTMVGAWLKSRAPEVIIVTVVAAVLAVAITAAVFFGAVLVACLAASAGCAQALGKLSLDALIQRDVPEEVRTSAFARSETSLQMGWVLGGAIGIVLPLSGVLGMSVGAAIVATGLLATVHPLWTAARRGPHVGPASRVPDSLRP